jgi:hypothetical protein
VFEMSAILNPIFGVVTGIAMTRGSDLHCVISGAVIGLTAGLAVHCVPVTLGKIIEKLTMTDEDRSATPSSGLTL